MIRIGILGHGFIEWGGGIDFLRTVVSSLHHSGEAVELHALLPTRGPRLMALRAMRHTYRTAKALATRAGPVPPRPDARHIADLAGSTEQPLNVHEIDIGKRAIAKATHQLSLDVILPAFAALSPDFPAPWVGYVYDFQHRYLPQLFSAADRTLRDKHFSAMLGSARAVIVNARAVASDIALFHPEAPAKVFALPFSAAPNSSWLAPSESPAAKFGILGPYFMVCNQFWIHKDHATAFAAFAKIAADHPSVQLVCTGPTDDYRNPAYFPGLQKGLARDGIADRVHILGMVSKSDQIALLKGSIAMIQPTLFEGGPGGGAVFDAVSLGVRCLVSDIAVNRELSELGVDFFPPGDATAVAHLLTAAARQPYPQRPSPDDLLRLGRRRRAACGGQILAAIAWARTDHSR
jgi:glycosyltransferase involved in cell wall biosynthesis